MKIDSSRFHSGLMAIVIANVLFMSSGVQGQNLAGPPELMSYQGVVYQNANSTYSGTVDIEFRLYTTATGGTPIWGEEHEDVTITKGLFNVYLGDGAEIDAATPRGSLADAFKTSPLYLAVRVGVFAANTREKIVSVPYALTAKHANRTDKGVPTGTMLMYSGASAPDGWVFCDGSSLDAESNTAYEALWSAIGTTWGGSGKSSFKVPNMQNVTPVGVGAGSPNNDSTHGSNAQFPNSPRPVNTKYGAQRHTLTLSEMPSHTHDYQDKRLNGISAERVGGAYEVAVQLGDHNRTSDRTGGNSGDGNGNAEPHNNVQPSLYVNFIIKL